MGKSKPLVIVESPAKIKTISKILGNQFKVMSSMGHLIDLPKSTLGVEIENDFEPKLIVLRDKQKFLAQLKKEAETKNEIYIATDPDREGEAIGWNLIQHIGNGKKVYRVIFQEITKDAVLKAFDHPIVFDKQKIDAQIARRILDRIVGYKISPILWKKVGSRLSAGRVQSVALRLIVERDKDIKKFVPQEYWQITADLTKEGYEGAFSASLEKISGEKIDLKDQSQADRAAEEIRRESFLISAMTEKKVSRKPLPPFITSTLQQEAFNKLGFDANRTMRTAQTLYEGIDVGGGETVGLITYMRTDSVNISQEALGKVRTFISETYGKDYLPKTPNVYRSKKSAQEAHEAIRPTSITRRPEDIRSSLDGDQFKLYDLIWKRFICCQMTPAVYLNKKMEISAGKYQFGASGSVVEFDGFLVLQAETREEDNKVDFSKFVKGDVLKLVELKPTQHFTKPPPRYSEASLVKALEEEGIGRPSTYASIIQTLLYRNYVNRDRGYFSPTALGILICDLLVEYFSKVMDVGFTAQMEESLDLIEEGKLESKKLLHQFYRPFKKELDFAMQNMEKTKTFIDKKCPECGRDMEVKWGRKGRFVSCSGFPSCKYAEPYHTGVKCPAEGCSGFLVERRSRRGTFYGCTKYPTCTYTANSLPKEDEKANE